MRNRSAERLERSFDLGWVYFIRCMDEVGLIKIGFAFNDPFARMAILQIGCPYKLHLLGVLGPCRAVHEKDMHSRFKKSRLRGEWFRPTPEIMACVKEELDQFTDDYLMEVNVRTADRLFFVWENRMRITLGVFEDETDAFSMASAVYGMQFKECDLSGVWTPAKFRKYLPEPDIRATSRVKF